MSGELTLPRPFAPLIRTARLMAHETVGRFAVIGGVAVAIRLTEAARMGLGPFDVRATEDLDAVVRANSSDEGLTAVDGGPDAGPDLTIDRVAVQTIPVEPVDRSDLEGLPSMDVLFVGGHWLAATTATELSVAAADESANIRVAAPAALVATKLHAAIDRSDAASRKRGPDLLDIHQLLSAFDRDGAIATELARHPLVARAVLELGRSVLVEDVTRSARAIRSWTDPGAHRVTADDLRDVGDALVTRLASLLRA